MDSLGVRTNIIMGIQIWAWLLLQFVILHLLWPLSGECSDLIVAKDHEFRQLSFKKHWGFLVSLPPDLCEFSKTYKWHASSPRTHAFCPVLVPIFLGLKAYFESCDCLNVCQINFNYWSIIISFYHISYLYLILQEHFKIIFFLFC